MRRVLSMITVHCDETAGCISGIMGYTHRRGCMLCNQPNDYA